jgi:hypothetical protein
MKGFEDSINQLRDWCTTTSLALEQKIKWKPLGYEAVTVAGEQTKVMMYDISNPNDTVNQLLSE